MLNLYCFETVIIAMRQAVPKDWSIYVVDLIHQKVVFSTHHAAVVGLTHHKVVVSQGRAEPTTFGGLNPPPFLQCTGIPMRRYIGIEYPDKMNAHLYPALQSPVFECSDGQHHPCWRWNGEGALWSMLYW